MAVHTAKSVEARNQSIYPPPHPPLATAGNTAFSEFKPGPLALLKSRALALLKHLAPVSGPKMDSEMLEGLLSPRDTSSVAVKSNPGLIARMKSWLSKRIKWPKIF